MDIKSANKTKSPKKSTVVGKNGSGQGQSLRKQAEENLRSREKLQPMVDPEDIQRFVHELRVHQVELEIQNEELRRSQEELAASQNRYLDLYDFAPVGYLTVNKAGIIVEANHTAAALLRVAPGTLIGQPIFRFIVSEDQDIYYLRHKASFATNEPQTCKMRLLRTDGKPFWARLECGPVRNDKQGSKVCRMVLIDIGDGVRMAAQRTHLEIQDRQLQKAESLGRMAGAIAHHFNNILTVVLGNLDLAMNEVAIESNAYQSLEGAKKAAGRAAELSGSMLTYLGQTLGKRQPLDLSEVCRTGLNRLKPGIPKQVELQVDFPAAGPIVKANAHQLRQLLKNLLTNGWEALSSGQGTVHLAVTTRSPADIPVNNRFPLDWQPEDCRYACLKVTDSGSGIDEKDLEKIFDPFFTRKFLGRGLGLPIVLGIVRAHYGVVTVTSTIDRGSELQVFLPIFAGDLFPTLEQAMKVPEIVEGGTLLVVDDEPMLLEIAQSALASLGFTVLTAKDGLEALEVFRQHRASIRCVLCDLVMPGIDGWETLTALRQIAPDIPVILSSGYDQDEVMSGDHDEWPQFFLGKPYDLAGLREAIQKAIANKGRSELVQKWQYQ
jgi:PAS domain S-box-containing protein